MEVNSVVKTTSAGCPGDKARTEMVEINPFFRDDKYTVLKFWLSMRQNKNRNSGDEILCQDGKYCVEVMQQ